MALGADHPASHPTALELADAEESMALDLTAALADDVRVVRIARAVTLSEGSAQSSLAMIRLLREAASFGIPVVWHGGIDGLDVGLVVHLPPPVAEKAGDVPTARWRELHQPGLCYYRLGPAFVFVKDVRPNRVSARYKIEQPDRFRSLESVVELAMVDDATRDLIADLETEGLVLQLGGWATLLPHRMRRWPVPAHEV